MLYVQAKENKKYNKKLNDNISNNKNYDVIIVRNTSYKNLRAISLKINWCFVKRDNAFVV